MISLSPSIFLVCNFTENQKFHPPFLTIPLNHEEENSFEVVYLLHDFSQENSRATKKPSGLMSCEFIHPHFSLHA